MEILQHQDFSKPAKRIMAHSVWENAIFKINTQGVLCKFEVSNEFDTSGTAANTSFLVKWNYRTGVFKKAGKNLFVDLTGPQSMYIHSVYRNIIVSVIHATFQ